MGESVFVKGGLSKLPELPWLRNDQSCREGCGLRIVSQSGAEPDNG